MYNNQTGDCLSVPQGAKIPAVRKLYRTEEVINKLDSQRRALCEISNTLSAALVTLRGTAPSKPQTGEKPPEPNGFFHECQSILIFSDDELREITEQANELLALVGSPNRD